MSPFAQFEQVWLRCDHLSIIHGYLAKNAAAVLQPDEILRAEWAARVSALDLYVHELVADRMVGIFEGKLPSCPGYNTFTISTETIERIRAAASSTDAAAAFDLSVRDQLSRRTFQYPDDIAAGIRLCSSVPLWTEVAMRLGATAQTKDEQAKKIKKELTQIAARRNKIVHEGDLQPTIPRIPWPIQQEHLTFVTAFIRKIVIAVEDVMK